MLQVQSERLTNHEPPAIDLRDSEIPLIFSIFRHERRLRAAWSTDIFSKSWQPGFYYYLYLVEPAL
jgi:hypothetical protein